MVYNNLNPNIKILSPEDVSIEDRLDVTSSHSLGIFVGLLGDRRVALKFSRPQSLDVITEANNLYALRGVPHTPELHGYLVGAPRLTRVFGVTASDFTNGALVKEFADGVPLHSSYAYFEPDKYHRETGANAHKQVALQVANYLRGCLERGLFETDIPYRDVIVNANSDGKVKVTKIDQSDVFDRRDLMVFSAVTFSDTIRSLLGLFPQLFAIGIQAGRGYLPNESELLERASDYFRSQGLKELPQLLISYSRGDFNIPYMTSKVNELLDDSTFLQFLTLWERSMAENGEYLIAQAANGVSH